ncbi:MAG: hypothetical protein HEQ32_04195 [Vampirovibrio sp.]
MSHPFELSADALRALRKLRPNEITQIRRALDVIKNDPQHGDTNCELLSQNNKHLFYRYRSTVGFVFYLIHKKKKQRWW